MAIEAQYPPMVDLIAAHGTISYAKRCKNRLVSDPTFRPRSLDEMVSRPGDRECGLPMWQIDDFFVCQWCDVDYISKDR